MVANQPRKQSVPPHIVLISGPVPQFRLGNVVATPGALAAFESAKQLPFEFLARHINGDWGVVCDEDKKANDQSVSNGTRIISAYELKSDDTIWIITEADRSVTTILLPEEY